MIEIIIFIFGSAVGSFLNVIICRLATGEGMVKNRSHCPKCGQVLRWYELIPIVSFFILRGRCRACREKISWQYPLVEAATGLLFVAVFQLVSLSVYQFGDLGLGVLPLGGDSTGLISGLTLKGGLQIGYYWFIISCLIIIFVYDLRHYIIPDKVLWPAIGAAIVYQLILAFDFASLRSGNNLFPELVEGVKTFYPYLLAALVAAAFFLFLVLITRGRGMGLGDVKLVFLMGLVLGWPSILLALFLAFCLGALVGVGLIILGRKTMKSQIPFGPFLILGTLAALFWGQQIIGFYPRLLV